MDLHNVSITLHHAKLIIGHTHSTLTEAEADELDAWVCESDQNVEIFEALTEIVDGRTLSLEELVVTTEDRVEIWVIAGLIARQKLDYITEEEKKQLDEWIAGSVENKRIYNMLTNFGNLQKLLNAKRDMNGPSHRLN
jgi:hypothetical protein